MGARKKGPSPLLFVVFGGGFGPYGKNIGLPASLLEFILFGLKKNKLPSMKLTQKEQ